jgi:hypothetical protein
MEDRIMDSERFDRIVRSFGQNRSRRQALRTLAGVAAGAVALGGAAAVEAGRCKNGKELCGTRKNASCKDLQTDVNNCGECGKVCSTVNGTPACSGGTCETVCTPSCSPGMTCCSGGCTTLDIPPTCGSCTVSCTGFADACNDPACTATGCAKKPAREGLTCNGVGGTCQSGDCK